MNTGRRTFLSLLSGSFLAQAAAPLLVAARQGSPIKTQDYTNSPNTAGCWLDLCAPFIVEDAAAGIHSEIVLTSDTFAGVRGYAGGTDQTEYEIYLYDATGRTVGPQPITRRLTVPAMQSTVITGRSLISNDQHFWGGMRIRLRPKGREPMHASDLFSSAFVRWSTPDSFDNVHANPDPLQWQNTEGFYYSMPFPPLAEYDCAFSLFNPYDTRSAGNIVLNDCRGQKLINLPYDLKPHASLLLALNTGNLLSEATQVFGVPGATTSKTSFKSELNHSLPPLTTNGGMLAVTNMPGTQKSFGYLLIRKAGRPRFSVEHPIHQGVFTPRPAAKPFDAAGKFVAKNVLYSPLLFRAKRVGDITLESLFHFTTGLPLEASLWLNLFATDNKGEVAWLSATDRNLSSMIGATNIQQGAVCLNAGQSCVLDFSRLNLQPGFGGGLALAVAPDTTHTLMKVEVRVPEWGAHAFTHFRPGLRSARSYQKPKQRGGFATDYITSGARLEKRNGRKVFDELIGIMNIDDQGIEGRPVLELFDSHGLITRIQLGSVPAFATRHFLVSELIDGLPKADALTLRLIDERATLLMSALHLDYLRRDIALDHGSDRFSTFLDYGCNTTS